MSGEGVSEAAVGAERYFQDRIDEGRFMIQRSRSSGAHVFYPRALAPGTGADDLEWVDASGDGVVHSTTAVLPGRNGGDYYNISLVDLAEGPRMMTRVIGIDPQAVYIGMAVRATIGEIAGKKVVLFTPAGDAA
ncbi:OB-fold domain-containing protein [Sphingomonas sp. AOB5]|uniref:Zn-ribbon domain-containing OB-fold protein n=1 Tax=Sphingomonas sp. AOB5 TaxID=3034017 RepID=UPI0023F9867E|nr:OB-fold domain-containing protein [Sphingomonas sp. AOB5]MDF7774816.1 OB-fold domain-containing protein [Sphingomonas sp. AOB5]